MTRAKQTYRVFGFASTHEALDAEALLGKKGIEVVPIPAPAAVSANCGIALRVLECDGEQAERFLLEASLSPQADTEIEDY